jgi:hypothetical protein
MALATGRIASRQGGLKGKQKGVPGGYALQLIPCAKARRSPVRDAIRLQLKR